MRLTPKPFRSKKGNCFLFKSLITIANLTGQTLQVFYPAFLMRGSRISFLIHQLTNTTPYRATLGYFILSMACISALLNTLRGAR